MRSLHTLCSQPGSTWLAHDAGCHHRFRTRASAACHFRRYRWWIWFKGIQLRRRSGMFVGSEKSRTTGQVGGGSLRSPVDRCSRTGSRDQGGTGAGCQPSDHRHACLYTGQSWRLSVYLWLVDSHLCVRAFVIRTIRYPGHRRFSFVFKTLVKYTPVRTRVKLPALPIDPSAQDDP